MRLRYALGQVTNATFNALAGSRAASDSTDAGAGAGTASSADTVGTGIVSQDPTYAGYAKSNGGSNADYSGYAASNSDGSSTYSRPRTATNSSQDYITMGSASSSGSGGANGYVVPQDAADGHTYVIQNVPASREPTV